MDVRTIEYFWNDAPEQLETDDVVVGDGTVDYSDGFDEFDPRIFFYFQDETEFQGALTEGVENFTITRVIDVVGSGFDIARVA